MKRDKLNINLETGKYKTRFEGKQKIGKKTSWKLLQRESERENERQEIGTSSARVSPRNSAEGVTNIAMSFTRFLYIYTFSLAFKFFPGRLIFYFFSRAQVYFSIIFYQRFPGFLFFVLLCLCLNFLASPLFFFVFFSSGLFLLRFLILLLSVSFSFFRLFCSSISLLIFTFNSSPFNVFLFFFVSPLCCLFVL